MICMQQMLFIIRFVMSIFVPSDKFLQDTKMKKMCTKKQNLGRPQGKERPEAFLDVVHFL